MEEMDNVLCSYQNGNVKVIILNDGTKIREFEDTPNIDHMESVDVKVTNYCDLGCPFCHEESTTSGKHADLERLKLILEELPAGIELAIGGGNPLSHPYILDFLIWCKNRGFICNMTMNQLHLNLYKQLLLDILSDNLIKGLGISIANNDYTIIKELQDISDNIVFHVIAGVNKLNVLDELCELKYCKVLVLGYKTYGRGIRYYSKTVQFIMNAWNYRLREYVGKCIISFDNLAIEQLDVQKWFTSDGWSKFYMGDDFTFTMYIDAVEQMYAPTSRDNNKISFNECSLIEYFKNNKN